MVATQRKLAGSNAVSIRRDGRGGDRAGLDFQQTADAMNREMEQAPEIVRPSKFWTDLNKKHQNRIAKAGIENFRRTLAKDYFTWMRVLPWDSQIRFLAREVGPVTLAKCALQTFGKHENIPLTESLALNFLTRLLWAYTEKLHPELSSIPEPIFGNPPAIMSGGRLISQDLANSVLEYASFAPAVSGTVCELGGGYGRNAYVTAKLGKFDRYIMSDISPALAVAQEFIGSTFPEKQIFTFRPFSDFSEVADEFERSRFAFLLPQQLSLLPDGSVDLFLNISSLHEMEQRQVDHYLAEIRRLVAPEGYFYLKAWETSNNPDAAEQINASDYDLSGFDEVFWRSCPVQTRFFETLQKRSIG